MSQTNLEKIKEVEQRESIGDVHWTMNDQWIELNGGGLLPAHISNSSATCFNC
jgi:hypothetical protein